MKNFIFFGVFIFFGYFAQAQMYLGVNGGYASSNIDFSPNEKTEAQYFPNFGITFCWTNLPNRGIQAEVNFVKQGWKTLFTDDFSYLRTFNMIEVPLLSHFNILNKKRQIIINLGPFVSCRINNKGNNLPNDVFQNYLFNETTQNKTHYYINNAKKYHFGLIGALGLLHKFESSAIQVEFRYTYGLTNFIYSEYITDSRTQNISIKMSYLFGI